MGLLLCLALVIVRSDPVCQSIRPAFMSSRNLISEAVDADSAIPNAHHGESPSRRVNAADSFVTAMKTLTSNFSVKQVVDVLDHIPVLQGELKAQDQKIKSQSENLEKLRAEHEVFNQKSLDKYTKSLEKVKEEKLVLTDEVFSVRAKLEQQNKITQGYKDGKIELQGQSDRLKEALSSQKNDLQKAWAKVNELQSALEVGDARIKQLESNAKRKQTTISQLSDRTKDLQEETSSLNEKLEAYQKRVLELCSASS